MYGLDWLLHMTKIDAIAAIRSTHQVVLVFVLYAIFFIYLIQGIISIFSVASDPSSSLECEAQWVKTKILLRTDMLQVADRKRLYVQRAWSTIFFLFFFFLGCGDGCGHGLLNTSFFQSWSRGLCL
jgi:hypothetical protein